MKNNFLIILLVSLILAGCVGVSSKGIFGTGVTFAFDPRSVGTQVDDSIMQKSLSARVLLMDKKYLLTVKTKVLDGRIFLTGKVDNPEEKLKLTKLAWETDGARSVRNDIKIKEELERLSNLNFCLVFFVSPKKINKIIPHLKKYFKKRKILICREISKYYEEFIRSDLDELQTFKDEPKGEITIVISEKKFEKKTSQTLSESDKRNIEVMINKLSTKEITDIISQRSEVSKKEIYKYCLKLKNEK